MRQYPTFIPILIQSINHKKFAMIDRLVLSSILKKKIIYLFSYFIKSCFYHFPLPYSYQVLMENSEKPSNDFSRFFTVRVLIGQANSYHHRGTRRGGGWMEPLPGVFNMLQYFETILPLLESL